MWRNGTTQGHRWSAKVYDSPSMFGIASGRVSKLYIENAHGVEVLNYDRGWDTPNHALPETLRALVADVLDDIGDTVAASAVRS